MQIVILLLVLLTSMIWFCHLFVISFPKCRFLICLASPCVKTDLSSSVLVFNVFYFLLIVAYFSWYWRPELLMLFKQSWCLNTLRFWAVAHIHLLTVYQENGVKSLMICSSLNLLRTRRQRRILLKSKAIKLCLDKCYIHSMLLYELSLTCWLACLKLSWK